MTEMKAEKGVIRKRLYNVEWRGKKNNNIA